ncbi:hypothetical protein L7F22_063315 [Adiantum nelumboides]|nr:hypothetical protein [Adiantum nelumboides]
MFCPPYMRTSLKKLQQPCSSPYFLEIHGKGRSGVACPFSHASASMPTLHFEKNDGIVIVDHGSRRAQSNAMIHSFVDLFKQKTGHFNVEPAHMELASPTIKEAFDKCIRQGASRVIVAPYFLSPGRHWDKDIPTLAAEATKEHQNISYIVTAPIGLHELMVIDEHISTYLIYVKEKDKTESSNLSSLDGSRRALLDEYADCFSKALPGQLPPERPEDHSIDLIPGNASPNKPSDTVSAAQQEEIMT